MNLEVPEFEGGNADSIYFDAADVASIIANMPDGKGQGPSGLGSTHLRGIQKNVAAFALHLAKLGNELLEDENAVGRVKALYRYRIQCIPKHQPHTFRPICVQEPFLTVLHRHIARRLEQFVSVSPDQFCFRKSGRPLALRKAKQLLERYPRILQLDVKNAFNSIPHNQIIRQLIQQGPGKQVIRYIQRFFNARWSDDLPGLHQGVGVPQGDPMSMLLFAVGVDPVIRQIKEEFGDISAYADDIVVGLPDDVDPDAAITRAIALYGSVGLEIQRSKCKLSTAEDFEFLGHPFQTGRRLTIAAHIYEQAKRKLAILTHFSFLRTSAAFVMLNRSLVPALNYGPLVEEGDDAEARAKYEEIDQLLMKTLSSVLRLAPYNLTPEQLRAFAIARMEDDGLEFMLPGEYFDIMRTHAEALMEGSPPGFLKWKYFTSPEYRAHNYQPVKGPWVVATMPFADMLDDAEIAALLAMRFKAQDNVRERCPACGKGPEASHTACPGYMAQVWGVHNDILRMLLGSMRGSRQATRYQTPMEGVRGTYLSDGHFTGQDGVTYQLDVSVVWHGDMAQRYYEKLRHSRRPNALIPFVLNSKGQIYEESLVRIRAAAPELKEDVLARATLIPLARRAAQRARIAAKASRGDTDDLVPEIPEDRGATAQPNLVAPAAPAQEQAARPEQQAPQQTEQDAMPPADPAQPNLGSDRQASQSAPEAADTDTAAGAPSPNGEAHPAGAGNGPPQQGSSFQTPRSSPVNPSDFYHYSGSEPRSHSYPDRQAQGPVVEIDDGTQTDPPAAGQQGQAEQPQPQREREGTPQLDPNAVWTLRGDGNSVSMTFTRQLNEREQEAIRNIQRQAEQNNARMLGAVQQAQEQPRGNGIREMDAGEANRQDMERVARPLHPERLRQQEENQQRQEGRQEGRPPRGRNRRGADVVITIDGEEQGGGDDGPRDDPQGGAGRG